MANATDETGTGTGKVIDLSTITKKDKRRSDEKWTKAVMARGYCMVPSILLWGQKQLGLSPEQLNVLLQLISHWWDAKDAPHPSKESIATRIGKDPRSVQRYLTQLEKAGFIARQQRFRAHRGQTSNGYSLAGLVKKLGEIEPVFRKVAEQNRLRRAKAEGA